MRARSFFYVSLGILALAAAYHLGATTARAQAQGPVAAVGGMPGTYLSSVDITVMTQSGDMYTRHWYGSFDTPLRYLGNFWAGGGATAARQESFGAVKVRYR